MSRLEFRAWNKIADRYSHTFGVGQPTICYTDDDGKCVRKTLTDEVIEQYTGLRDKNGNKIFEGDICKDFSTVVQVIFRNGCFMFSSCQDTTELKNKGACDFHEAAFQCYYKRDECELTENGNINMFAGLIIIGNIHENPELMEQS